MVTIAQVSQAMQTVLSTVADTAARATNFVQRSSKLTGALFTQTLVFGFLANPNASRQELAQTAAALGLSISPQALDQRLSQNAADCLLEVLETAASTLLAADPAAIPLLSRFNGVFIQDSSLISLPSSLAHIWRGSGNQNTSPDSVARLKLSLRLELSTGQLIGPHIDHGLTSDRKLLLQQQPIPRGGLRLADLGFFDLKILRAIEHSGAYWLSRPQITTVMTDLEGVRLDLVSLLAAQDSPSLDMPIRLGAREKLRCRLVAVRVAQEVADQRRRRLREEAKRRGRQPNAIQMALCDWTIFVTNVPSELLSVKEALTLGRARWQIELLFKLWKSQGQVDLWRSAKASAILCELYAKLIGMVVQHWIMLVGLWAYADRSLMKAAATVRKQALWLASGMGCQSRLAEAIESIVACLASGCRINKSKKTPHTFQLLLDLTQAALD